MCWGGGDVREGKSVIERGSESVLLKGMFSNRRDRV